MPEHHQVEMIQYNRGRFISMQDTIISESKLTIMINDYETSSFLCSWNEVEQLVIGNLFTEGWISSIEEILSLEISEPDKLCKVYIPQTRFLEKNQDSFLSTGCGHKKQSSRPFSIAPREYTTFFISPAFVISFMQKFQHASPLFQTTGGVHSVALIPSEGDWILHEDIGRHNALDKAIGYGLQQSVIFSQSCLATSGRISSDMMMKVLPLPIPILISKSAITDAAINLALKAGITLVGFARGERCNIYTYPERIKLSVP